MDQGQSTAGIANLITEANGFNAGGVKLGVIFFDRYMYIYPSVGKLLSLLSFIITTMLWISPAQAINRSAEEEADN